MLGELLTFVAVVYLAIMLGMFLLQRSLMYYPETHIGTPVHHGLPGAMVVTLSTGDGLAIEIWHHEPASENWPTILYFHGNTGHVGDRAPKLKLFTDAGFGVLALSYRGYGKSEGKPDEPGLYEDARTAVHYATRELGLSHKELLLYGESLGSGVATHTAHVMAQNGTPVGGLILEAPFMSVAQRSQELYPFIPAKYLVRDRYHSIRKIAHIEAPLLLFHGERDQVIPVHHGRALLAQAKEPKQGIFFEETGHTSFDFSTLAGHMVDFAKKHRLLS